MTLGIACVLRAAVILFQCPASFQPKDEAYRNLEVFFRRVGNCPHLLGWEPRGDWPKDVVRDLCSRLGLIHCVDPFADEAMTGGVRYYRLHGRRGYRYRYTDQDLHDLCAKIVTEVKDEAYVMFNNVWMKDDAARFIALAR